VQGQVVQPLPVAKSRQRPPTQTLSRSQRLPQSPQLKGSVAKFTQAFPHWVVAPRHVPRQLPPAQTCPPAQELPALPQLLGSVWRLTQLPPTAVKPGRQTQADDTQYWVSLHWLPRVPQLLTSRVKSTQRPRESVRGGGH